MRRTPVVLTMALILVVVSVAGCGGAEEHAESAAADATAVTESSLVERAATIALEIEAAPDSTEQILESHGLDADAFEAMLLEISEDESMRKAYTALLEGDS